MKSLDSFNARCTLTVGNRSLEYFSLPRLEKAGLPVSRLPYSLRILLENLLRFEDNRSVSRKDIEALANWDPKAEPDSEISFMPARVILQDFTGVPCVVDFAAMRDAMAEMSDSNGSDDAAKINPLMPAELVIDHSVQVDEYGSEAAFFLNNEKDYERNVERYVLLRWGQKALRGFRVVPPATGIVHQVNLEYLARVVFDSDGVAYPDTVIGTDSHTTMINGLGVLGWGVGGIEAEAAMLGQPIPLLIPQVLGFKLHGDLPEGSTATDLVLTVTQMLRKKGVVGKFVEFYGAGLSRLGLADRATIGNMSPEFGSTCAIFPIDAVTVDYLRFSGRDAEQVALVEAYAKAQGLYHSDSSPEPDYSDKLELDLATVVPSLAGPRRPQDRVTLKDVKRSFAEALPALMEAARGKAGGAAGTETAFKDSVPAEWRGEKFEVRNGSVVVAAITSCTNTSNPSVMIGAGLVAKKAAERGLTAKPWVKTSLAPGSKVVTEYLNKAGLTPYLNALNFHNVGYGCTTCIGNSGPLPPPVSEAVHAGKLVVAAVLSGNRNFEGRINPDVRANYLASPPLVVAYAIAGRMDIDLYTEPIGNDRDGREVFLRDIWPTQKELRETMAAAVLPEQFRKHYADVFTGDEKWRALPVPEGSRFAWDPDSTYVRRPTFLMGIPAHPVPPADILGARVLALLGDSVTTDHISPAGSIKKDSPAGKYLIEHGVAPGDFNSYGARRGNHEVMMRGTFANIRLRNRLVEIEGGFTKHLPDGETMSIFDASVKYEASSVPLLVIAGKEYGSGSSRDWAAKGTAMLGVRGVIAESYERIHRSNLIGMGVLPMQFLDGASASSIGVTGLELFSVMGIAELSPGKILTVSALRDGGGSASSAVKFEVKCRIDTSVELDYFR
ncbi:MAG: aconitate hydratase AcnA, partial [Candidatus Hydrogenedentota bacterium]